MNEVLITIAGKTKSMSAWCREFGVSINAVCQMRDRRGISFEMALKATGRRTKYEINGVLKSQAEWCRIYGVSDNTVRNRMKNGMTFEEAIKSPPLKPGKFRTSVTIDGVAMSKTEWCRRFGVRLKLVERRVREGMSFEAALKIPVRKGKSGFRMMCDQAGIDHRTARGRINRGWSLKKALSTKPLPKDSPDAIGRHKIVVDGVATTAQSASKALGMSPSVVGYRIRHGWDKKDAVKVHKIDNSNKPGYKRVNERRRELAEMGIVY